MDRFAVKGRVIWIIIFCIQKHRKGMVINMEDRFETFIISEEKAGKQEYGIKGMTHVSFRELSDEEIKRIRQQVVLLKKIGKTGKEIEELTGVGQSRVSEIWKAYQCNGEAALEVKKRGVQRILFPEEEVQTRETILNRQPKEFGLPGDLWTMNNVCRYVWITYQKKLTDRCASNYMRRWGLNIQGY